MGVYNDIKYSVEGSYKVKGYRIYEGKYEDDGSWDLTWKYGKFSVDYDKKQ